MKHILGNQSELLINRHIDQLILCCIYSYCKICKINILFKSIIQVYENLNQHNSNMIRELIYDMPLGENNKTGDIVTLYNNIFIQSVKNYILNTAKNINSTNEIINNTNQIKNPAITTPIFTSPLKSMLPSDVRKSLQKMPNHL
ncbi:hypothetical protein IMG5_199290 [Ichthyophthirius multifiliis]|uniref:Retinoblastoma-associated protein B-box domain-containing protein n=1 Tax=Ichthyophthirius multifiliis TaxID=5932 RepID=G0R5I9_ICHMU|nr:hypothetical protein IMG5_199290 [Ichthyophthirius multifiliis]EGR27249.1 hypothetical protein IMG5_199290 [Ichthyophthirius multifiliis]|eukprot:XP_004024133.1 hypothetical protein IMG5_199290 [Ichthyophthirius multifiliis]